jgi:hypothetical protein
MNKIDILRRAASLMSTEAAYSRHAKGAACIAWTDVFSATLALERSARPLRSGSALLGAPFMASLEEAKNAVCRVVGFPHIDAWEAEKRPGWAEVKRVFQLAESA